MNPITLALIMIFGIIGAFELLMAIIKTKWSPVEGICLDCEHSEKFAYHTITPWRKTRHYLSGYQATFSFDWNGQECTGKQLMPFNFGKCYPGNMYTIKVNPRRPQNVATRIEIVGDYLAAIFCITMAVLILLAEYHII